MSHPFINESTISKIFFIKPSHWHNGSAFTFCPGDCPFKSELNPTSAYVCGEVIGCDAGWQEVSSCSTIFGS